MTKIGIIGAGNMGEALIKGVKGRFFVSASDIDPLRARYLKKTYHIDCQPLKDLVSSSEVIILAVKPQDFDAVLGALKTFLTKNKIVLSIAAGITTRYIERKLGKACRVVRAMPNMPALIGQGITAICKGRYAKPRDLEVGTKILACVGEVVCVEEKQIDAVTAVSGSGPAYVALFMECLTDSAKELGLDEDLGRQLVAKTFSGTVRLLESANISPAELRTRVTSKGGTTQAAYDVFIRLKLDRVINQALKAAKKRAGQLAKR